MLRRNWLREHHIFLINVDTIQFVPVSSDRIKYDHKERFDKLRVLRHGISHLQICFTFFKLSDADTNGRQGKTEYMRFNNESTDGITQGDHDIL